MNQDSNAILTLCSHLCVGQDIVPLEPKEWSGLAQRLLRAGKRPSDLFTCTEADMKDVLGLDEGMVQRIMRLLDRNASLGFALEEYSSIGIQAVTRADPEYPARLKQKLANSCPPIFYCAGDMTLLNRQVIGYVGSRDISIDDLTFTRNAVRQTTARGYGVVSGGAKGVDSTAEAEALLNGSFAIEYLSDSMQKKLKKSETVKNIQNGRLLMLSVAKPDAGFHVGIAMMRNRYIYAQSEGTLVVRSDLNKGGTWAGACENLKNQWCPMLCRDAGYAGNQALIQKGAVPVGADWDGTVSQISVPKKQNEEPEQLSIFDL